MSENHQSTVHLLRMDFSYPVTTHPLWKYPFGYSPYIKGTQVIVLQNVFVLYLNTREPTTFTSEVTSFYRVPIQREPETLSFEYNPNEGLKNNRYLPTITFLGTKTFVGKKFSGESERNGIDKVLLPQSQNFPSTLETPFLTPDWVTLTNLDYETRQRTEKEYEGVDTDFDSTVT